MRTATFGDLRGAIERAEVPAEAWAEVCAILDAMDLPPERVAAEIVPYLDARCRDWPDHARVCPHEWWLDLAQGVPAPQLAACRALDLSGDRLATTRLVEVARAPELAPITCLDLSENHLGGHGVAALWQTPLMSGLRALYLRQSRLGEEGVRAVFERGARLEVLVMPGNLSVPPRQRLPWEVLARVERLEIGENALDNKQMAPLTAHGALPALKHLSLAWFGRGEGMDLYQLLVRAPWVPRLRVLDLRSATLHASPREHAARLIEALARVEAPLERLIMDWGGLGIWELMQLAALPALQPPATLIASDHNAYVAASALRAVEQTALRGRLILAAEDDA